MQPKTREFKPAAAAALANKKIQASLSELYNGFHTARIAAAQASPDWDSMRDRARAIKAHTLDNLDHYLELAERSVTSAGGTVFFAKDAEAANRYVIELARSRGVKVAIKSKSMLSEEMGLNDRLAAEGVEPVETDLGEFILQLAGEKPYHIIAPAIHKSREDISALFHEKLDCPLYAEPAEMTREARKQLRRRFLEADMGITGANFVVAETGTLVLVTNEDNGRMCTTMPRIHVAIMGMEKIIPSLDDLGLFLRLLIGSATGQRMSCYVTTITGSRRADEEDGPDEFHLIILDNGRTRLLADPDLRESLYCLRCGACLNACPVYRKVGGHAYGWVYPGPIGAVISPMLTRLSEAKDLPYASSLCGECREACPVRVNVPRMLLHLRRELVEGKVYPSEKRVSPVERLAFKGWRLVFSRPFLLGLASRAARLLQRPLVALGLAARLPGLSGWTRYRRLPHIASRPFRDRWADLMKD